MRQTGTIHTLTLANVRYCFLLFFCKPIAMQQKLINLQCVRVYLFAASLFLLFKSLKHKMVIDRQTCTQLHCGIRHAVSNSGMKKSGAQTIWCNGYMQRTKKHMEKVPGEKQQRGRNRSAETCEWKYKIRWNKMENKNKRNLSEKRGHI